MDVPQKATYSTATSLTARHINRRIILNIIYRQQPISRADTARETGLQRSTVSLIVDELIRDGWIVEGEHGRIPRGRRPIYLQLNAAGAGVYSVVLRGQEVELSASDLNGNCLWVGRESLSNCTMQHIADALRQLRAQAQSAFRHQMKGVGVAVEGVALNKDSLRAAIAEVFGVPVAVGSVALACAKWFLLKHKDARLASDHLLSVHIDHEITMGAIIAGRPLQGAHGRAVNLLALTDPEGACSTTCGSLAGNGAVAGSGAGKLSASAGECLDRVAEAVSMGVAAYDPGVVLVSGDFASDATSAEQQLASHLESIGAADTAVRVLDTGGAGADIYRHGAMGLIFSHFLGENGE